VRGHGDQGGTPRDRIDGQREVKCYQCGIWGHIRPDCPELSRNGGGDEVYTRRCHACRSPTHLVRDCPLNTPREKDGGRPETTGERSGGQGGGARPNMGNEYAPSRPIQA
jgi:hypothetical protein